MTFQAPEQYRIKHGILGTEEADGCNGLFLVPIKNRTWRVIASDGDGWEHVSISHRDVLPNWAVMCAIKDLFWSEEDCVVQYHPAKSEYVNCHPNTLHLWRPIGVSIPKPPTYMVGPMPTRAE